MNLKKIKEDVKFLLWTWFKSIVLLPLILMIITYDKYGLKVSIISLIISSIVIFAIFFIIYLRDKKNGKKNRSLIY